MIVKKTEWHSVASEFSYDIDDEAIIEEFGSVQRFKEIISHQEQGDDRFSEPEIDDQPNLPPIDP